MAARVVAGSALALALAAVWASVAISFPPLPDAHAGHAIHRGISIHYSGDRFTGRIKSESPSCLNGLIELHKIKRGPNPIVGSDFAGSNGDWSISKRAKHGRFYASTAEYQSPAGLCREVRSRVIELG